MRSVRRRRRPEIGGHGQDAGVSPRGPEVEKEAQPLAARIRRVDPGEKARQLGRQDGECGHLVPPGMAFRIRASMRMGARRTAFLDLCQRSRCQIGDAHGIGQPAENVGTLNGLPDIAIEDKVRFLQRPEAYGRADAEVLAEETHMSWVFLAGDRVYKLKKPVRYPFLDFSTIEARERNCREEVRLNRRLAAHIYLGIVPLTATPAGELAIDGEGATVDWLVLMRRLPRERMLDRAIGEGTVRRDEIVAVADRLAAFYRDAEPAALTAEAFVRQFIHEQATTRAVLTDPAFGLDHMRVADMLGRIEDVLRNRTHLLASRVEQGRVVEGHGDLRPEHVCLGPPPVVIDCLEFNRSLRLVDPLDELTFLGLECKRLGAGWIGPLILARYAESRSDPPPQELIAFYWRYRACLRARLSLVHILERDRRKPEKWLPLAKQYLALAEAPELSPALP